MDDFVKCYNPRNRLKRKETERFKAFPYEEIIKRDKTSLDIFWLKDKSLQDTENLRPPEEIAEEIAGNLTSALESVNELISSLEENNAANPNFGIFPNVDQKQEI